MNKKIVGIIIPIFVVILAALMFYSPSSEISTQKSNEKIGLVINSPSSSVSLKQIDEIPQWMQDVFVTAMDIHWADHLMAQSVWQDWIGNAIAKTINMPYDVTVDDVKSSYLLAHELGLKGMTVYRDGSRHKQVLHMTSENAQKTFEVTPSEYMLSYIHENITNPYIKTQVGASLAIKIHDEEIQIAPQKQEEVSEDRLCPTCKNNLVFVEGCSICIECGYSGCTSG